MQVTEDTELCMAKSSRTKGVRPNGVLKGGWEQPKEDKQDCDNTWPRHLRSGICKWRCLKLEVVNLSPPFSKLPAAAAELRCCSSQLPSQGNGLCFSPSLPIPGADAKKFSSCHTRH